MIFTPLMVVQHQDTVLNHQFRLMLAQLGHVLLQRLGAYPDSCCQELTAILVNLMAYVVARWSSKATTDYK